MELIAREEDEDEGEIVIDSRPRNIDEYIS